MLRRKVFRSILALIELFFGKKKVYGMIHKNLGNSGPMIEESVLSYLNPAAPRIVH